MDIKELQRTEGSTALLGANRGRYESFKAFYECPRAGYCAGAGLLPNASATSLSSWPQQLPCRVAEHVGDGRKNTVTARGLLVAGPTPDADKSLRHAG